MAWLQSIFSGGSAGLTLVLIVLGLAIALVLLFWVFRKIAGDNALKPGRNRQPRLSVTDAAIVDDKRRLVLVRRDNIEHLVMIGGPTDIVVEQGITRTQPVPTRTAPMTATEPEAPPARTSAPSEPPAASTVPEETAEPSRPAAPFTRPAAPAAPIAQEPSEKPDPLAAPAPEPAEPRSDPSSRLARLRTEAAALVSGSATAGLRQSETETSEAAAQEPSPTTEELPAEPTAEPGPATEAPIEVASHFEPTIDGSEIDDSLSATVSPVGADATAAVAEAPVPAPVEAELSEPPAGEPAPAAEQNAPDDAIKPDSMEAEMQRLLDELASPKQN